MAIAVGPVSNRQLAAILAVELAAAGVTRKPLADEAEDILRLLSGITAAFTLAVTVSDPHGTVKYHQSFQNGAPMPDFQMTVDDTLTLSAAPTDDHGDPTSDQLTFTPDDNGSVATLAVSGNTCTVTPVAEGTVNIEVADPAAPNVAAATATVTIGAGPTAAIQVTGVVNTGANPAPAPAGP
jgi:hypothetical protein